MSSDVAHKRWQQWTLCLATSVVGLLGAVVFLWLERSSTGQDVSQAIYDDVVVEQAVQRLVDQGKGIFDSHPDPDVGRVLQPGLGLARARGGGGDDGRAIVSNEMGLRTGDWREAPSRDRLRVVLLGDSFVFGQGAMARDRLGEQLEALLSESLQGADAEVFSVGIPSWNIRAECEFLRRQLDGMQPDLVLHVVVNNDLNDSSGVRGFGSQASFSDQHRGRVDGMVRTTHPRMSLGASLHSWLNYGLDFESRSRFEDARQRMQRLQFALEAAGAAYVVVNYWSHHPQVPRERIYDELEGATLLYVPTGVSRDPELQLARGDPHWNVRGAALMARTIVGGLAELGPLRHGHRIVVPERFKESTRVRLERGRSEAMRELNLEAIFGRRRISAAIQVGSWSDAERAQVHGGLLADGSILPYASMILRNAGTRIVLEGRRLASSALTGRAQVFVEEFAVGEIQLAGAEPIVQSFAIPETVRERAFITLRIESDDWIYQGRSLRNCVCFKLHRVAVE